MVNVGLSPGSILGIVVAVAGALLYFLRSWRPELARDTDIFFAAVGLLCGGILFFQGWRLDPILMFGQLLLTGSTVFFAIESIRMRRVATDQARRNTPIVDDDRPVSRVYRAEIDELDAFEEEDDYPPVRRIRGAGSSRGQNGYVDELEEETRSTRRLNPRRPSSSRPSSDRPTSSNPRRRSPRPDNGYTDAGGYGDPSDDAPPSDRPRRSRSNPNRPTGDRAVGDRERPGATTESAAPPRSTRRRPRPDRPVDSTASDGDYVDYQPVDEKAYKSYTDQTKNESDNSSNFDDDLGWGGQ